MCPLDEIGSGRPPPRLGFLDSLAELVKGKRGVTADTAWRLSALLGTSPEVWMNLQMHWDLWQAAQTRRTA
jgi:plasmid maintenance system antidote protein VapI